MGMVVSRSDPSGSENVKSAGDDWPRTTSVAILGSDLLADKSLTTMNPTALADEPTSTPPSEAAASTTVLLPTLGSAGDVHPVLAVARALRDQGHHPVVVTSEWFEPTCRAMGVDFEPLLDRGAFERAARNPDIWHPWRGFGVLSRDVIVPAMKPLFELIEGWAERTDDLVVASSILCLGARLAGEKLGVAQASMHVQPVVLRSRTDTVGTPHLNYPRRGPRWRKNLAYAIADATIADPVLCPELNAFRSWLGLPRVRRPLDGWIHSDQSIVGLWPDWYAHAQDDWPAHVTLTDFPLFDPGEDEGLSNEVEAYLAAGEPPVVFTGGSANVHGDDLHAIARRTCARLGVRGLFLAPEPESLPPSTREFATFGFTPLGALLPRCRAIVHHGGIGTTGRALHAGLPQVVVPHSHDQPDNAMRVRHLGAGDFVPSASLTARRLASVLGTQLERGAFDHAGRRAGTTNGPDAAARAITRLGSAARA